MVSSTTTLIPVAQRVEALFASTISGAMLSDEQKRALQEEFSKQVELYSSIEVGRQPAQNFKMTMNDKRNLGKDIRKLSQRDLMQLIALVRSTDKAGGKEIEIGKLSNEHLFSLRSYVDRCLAEGRRAK